MTTDNDQLARVFKALSDPSRLAILERLRECCGPGCCLPADRGEGTVSALAARLGLAVSTVSHHIKELRTAGLVRCERDGRFVHCTVDEAALAQIASFAAAACKQGEDDG